MTTIDVDVEGQLGGTKAEGVRLVDACGAVRNGVLPWAPVKIEGERIDAEIERLSQGPTPPDGRRVALLVHPEATGPGLGLAPGVQVAVEVLLPGEATAPVRQNASLVQIGLRGEGVVAVAGVAHVQRRWDVATVPAMRPYVFRNESSQPWVRLSYSNSPLLAALGVHYVERLASVVPPGREVVDGGDYVREKSPDVPIGTEGARLRGYEHLVDIEVVDNPPLLWPWSEVEQHLSSRPGDGKRPIMAYYNPATGRRSGATQSFFVTAMTVPPGSPRKEAGPGHRHTSVAINYHFRGRGSSVVDGREISWKAGDLLLSAPGWSEHAHFWGDEGFGAFTVQDHPLQIAMESLVWQEELDGPVLALGSEAGQTGYLGPRQAGT